MIPLWLKYRINVLRYERHRVTEWRQRHHPLTGQRYSWLEALRATVENPPMFDSFWDRNMEP